MRTNSKGEYVFKTIIPGEYNATSDWIRPPHIHFKVSLRGHEELVTQSYFKGYDNNMHDRILQSLTRDQQKEVVIDFKNAGPLQIPVGKFDITLNRL